MAIQEATYYSHSYIEARDLANERAVLMEILFTITGTYAAADGCRLSNVDTLVNAATFGGTRISAVIDAMRGRSGSQASDPGNKTIGIKTVAVSGANVTFKLTDNSFTTELADGAIPAQSRPLSMLVWAQKVSM